MKNTDPSPRQYFEAKETRFQLVSRIILLFLLLFVAASVALSQRYRVRAVSSDGRDTSTSNTVVKGGTPYIYFPNTFTPNGDGLNERFFVITHNVNDINVSIFSSQGALMADWNTPSGYWDGKNAMVGVYIVLIEWTGNDGKYHEDYAKLVLVR